MWEIELGGKWTKFDAHVGKALVDASGRGASEYKFEHKGEPYVIDMRAMVQKNLKSGKTRPVRDTSKMGGSHSGGATYVHSAPSAPAAAPAKSGGGPGFKTGLAGGVVVAAGAAVGVGLATGAITGDDIAGVAGDVGDALAGAAEDIGEAIVDAADDVADLL